MLVKLITVLLLAILVSACKSDNNSDKTTNAYNSSIITSDTVTLFTPSKPDSDEMYSVEPILDDDEIIIKKFYQYIPPQEVLDTQFYCDSIEAEISFEGIATDVYNSEDEFYEALINNAVPNEIADSLLEILSEPPFYKDTELNVVDISYFKYDLNSDGSIDYLLSVQLSMLNDPEIIRVNLPYHFELAYISQDIGYRCVELPVFEDIKTLPKYILSSYTNGLKDLFVFRNSNESALKYDGVNSYGNAVELDESHIFLKGEIISDNILHLNMNISVIESYDEYYVAIKFADNPYLKGDLLYTSYSDGTPRLYADRDNDTVFFSPGINGYDFYIELSSNCIANGYDADKIIYDLDLLEIKYIRKG